MKKHIKIFFLITFLGLAVLPVINLFSQKTSFKDDDALKALYSTNSLERFFNRFLVEYGISSNSNQVMVGTDNWLFLGDEYANTISAYRAGPDVPSAGVKAAEIKLAQAGWQSFFKANGVEDYKVLIGPNKSTIYAEYLPRWARSSNGSISEHLYESDVYIDSRKALKASKNASPLYYFTDTHWNSYGAGIAFRDFMLNIRENSNLKQPPLEWTSLIDSQSVVGGDLSSFLKIKEDTHDQHPTTGIVKVDAPHAIYDFRNATLLYEGDNPLHGNMSDLNLIQTPKALNNKRVLWLSDSFGSALAPYMTATFTQVLKQHWKSLAGTEDLKALVKDWKPDYVFVTVVERASLSEEFAIKLP